MEAEKLRAKANELESRIKELTDQFIKEVGKCEIDIDIINQYIEQQNGIVHHVFSKVKVNITI